FEEIPVPRVISHPLNIVLTKEVAQRMSNKIVINRATWRELQMTLPIPNIVRCVVGGGLLGEPLLRQPAATVAMPHVSLLPDQDEGAEVVDRGQIEAGVNHRQFGERGNPAMARFPEARRHERRRDRDALVEREAPIIGLTRWHALGRGG